ncbi:hypothetical protein PS2_008187 [Malus domestica]
MRAWALSVWFIRDAFWLSSPLRPCLFLSYSILHSFLHHEKTLLTFRSSAPAKMDSSDHSFRAPQLISHPHFVSPLKPQAW